MATHSSILAWRIPWTEEPGGLQSVGVAKVGCNLASKPPLLNKIDNPRGSPLSYGFEFSLLHNPCSYITPL